MLSVINFTQLSEVQKTVFDMHCPKPIRGPEFQPCKSRSSELY